MHAELHAPNRLPATRAERLNPLWWLGDAERPAAWPAWRHFLRNPCANLFAVILGIAHRPRLVTWARGDGWTFAPVGWNWGYSLPFGGWLPRPFLSWRGRHLEACIGWKTSGVLSLSLRRANSPNQAAAP